MARLMTHLALRIFNLLRRPVRRVYLNPIELLNDLRGQELTDQFNDLFYRIHGGGVRWRGIPLIKNPCDLWVISELLHEVRPGVVIETGTAEGGSALWFADMCRAMKLNFEIITIDSNPKCTLDDPLVHQVIGRSTSPQTVRQVEKLLSGIRRSLIDNVMVFLDSDHSMDNVQQELQIYSRFVTVDSYLVVEDTNVNGHPSYPSHGPGPFEAVERFLALNSRFMADRSREKFFLTFNPNGYLRRTS